MTISINSSASINHKSKKLKAGAVAKSIVSRVAHPKHLIRAINLQRARKKNKRAYDDAQLATLARILPGGFLHYGYFDDPERKPEDMSINEVGRAQERYAELLIELMSDHQSPVLDVGCGMGAMSGMLQRRGCSPVALTPDRLQAEHVRRTYPDIPLIQSKFEDLPDADQHEHRYGTVFTSESLQYLKLDAALPLMQKILKPGGKWIACDYFRTGQAHEKSGHNWDDFRKRLDEHGWEITYERDVTAHILPTLRYAYMWATTFGMPMMEFGLIKLQKKQPAVHYILGDALKMLDEVIGENLKTICPKHFAESKRYMLLSMQRRVNQLVVGAFALITGGLCAMA